MSREMLWSKGRLGWPAVLAVVFLTLWLHGFDLAWRFVTVSFVVLAVAGALGAAAGLAVIVLCARRSRTPG